MGKKFCQTCSNQVLATMRFCQNCGGSVFAASAPKSTPPSPSAFATPTTGQSPKPSGPQPSSTQATSAAYPHSTIPTASRSTPNQSIILALGAALTFATFLLYPTLNESANSSCHALEKKAFALLAVDAPKDQISILFGGAFLTGITNGELANTYIKQIYPALPPAFGCSLAYWKILVSPTGLLDLIKPIK